MKSFQALLALTLGAFHTPAVVVYNNTTSYQETELAATAELGDQIVFAGAERILDAFNFEIFARSVGTNATVRLRIYLNDGPPEPVTSRPTPGTVLYETVAIPVFWDGFFAMNLSGLNIRIPADSITWTLELSGIAPGGEAGLLHYGPPSIGSSEEFFWEKENSGAWRVVTREGLSNNFSARAEAIEDTNPDPDPDPDPEPTPSDQPITLSGRFNYVGIEVISGSNTLAELFPDAPAGTAIFKFDNARGYEAYEKYDFGWSRPEATILPGEGFIAMMPYLPDNSVATHSYSTILRGFTPANVPAVFRGWNLVSSDFIKGAPPGFLSFHPLQGDTVFTFLKEAATYAIATYDALAQDWNPGFVSGSGNGVWFHAGPGWPENPAGTAEANITPIYVNNRSAAFKSDARFVSSTGVPLTGEAQLYAVLSNLRVPIGAPIPLGRGEHAGYVDPTANLIRYLEGPLPASYVDLVIAVNGPEGSGETAPVQVFNATFGPLVVPTGLSELRFIPDQPAPRRVPEFLVPPRNVTGIYGGSVELRSVFSYPTDPLPTNSLAFEQNCPTPDGCPVAYQWQRQIGGEWLDVISLAASTDTLRIEALEEIEFTNYRLRARWGTNEAYSAEATVFRPLTIRARNVTFSAQSVHVEFDTTAGDQAFFVIDVSEDLKTWLPATCPQPIDNSKLTSATLEQPADVRTCFFRLRAAARKEDLLSPDSPPDCD